MPPNGSPLSCGTLKRNSFLNLCAPAASSACWAAGARAQKTLRVEQIGASNLDGAAIREQQLVHNQVVFFDSHFMDDEVTMPSLSGWCVNSVAAHSDIRQLVYAIVKGTKQAHGDSDRALLVTLAFSGLQYFK